jgi:thymidylate kinase
MASNERRKGRVTGLTVALVGADGAGKTTAGRRLERSFPRPVKYLYMGVNTEASNALLPTTRLLGALRRARGASSTGGPPDPGRRAPPPRGKAKRMWRGLRSILRLANRLAEEWFRQTLAWYHLARGRIVVFDRHFYSDYYAHDIVASKGPRSLDRRLHGWMLQHLYPRPDMVILLDAPAEVLWERKQEGSFEALARRRQEYLRLGDVVGDFAVVDATQPEDVVMSEIRRLILDRCGPGKGPR